MPNILIMLRARVAYTAEVLRIETDVCQLRPSNVGAMLRAAQMHAQALGELASWEA